MVCSAASADLVRDAATFELRDLGEHRLRDLSRPERIFQLVGGGLVDEFPPLASLDAFPGNLPVQLTSFIGRDQELREGAKASGSKGMCSNSFIWQARVRVG